MVLWDIPDAPGDRRVLVVDDDADQAGSIQDLLEARGYETAVAGNAAGARDLVQRFAPHVALLDIALGRESGLDLIGPLRQQDQS